MNKIICSNCRNNHTSNPIAGGLGTVFCFDCSTETEVKTGKKVFASRIHPTNPYNFSEDELFLILSLGSIILEVAEKPKKIDKIYEYLKWRDPNTKEGIGLEKEKIKIIKKRLKEGYNVWLGIRDVEPDEKNPWTAEQILEMVKEGELKELIEAGKVLPTIIPDIESINYGRGVGYDIIEHVPPKEIGDISATSIRNQMKKDGKL